MSEMHATTRAVLLQAIRGEIDADPTGRGYGGKSAAQIAALMSAPVPQAAPEPEQRAFKWGDARGIAQAHGCWPFIVLRARKTPAMPPAGVEDWAILAAINAVSTEREQVIDAADENEWAAFTGGIQAFRAVGDLTQAAATAILALGTHQPPTPPDGIARWLAVIDGISAAETPAPVAQDDGTETVHPGYAGPPNAADEALIQEALNG